LVALARTGSAFIASIVFTAATFASAFVTVAGVLSSIAVLMAAVSSAMMFLALALIYGPMRQRRKRSEAMQTKSAVTESATNVLGWIFCAFYMAGLIGAGSALDHVWGTDNHWVVDMFGKAILAALWPFVLLGWGTRQAYLAIFL
jgi:uncharacterized membrane protein